MLKSGPKQVTGFQAGGLVNMRNTQKQPETFEHYTAEFYQRQAKRVSGTSIIIVNNKAAPKTPAAPSVKSQYTPATDDMPTYSDIAQAFYRYVGGIKV